MRLSTDKDDPGYQDPDITSRAHVFFNGHLTQGVFTADEEKGLIVQAFRDDKGKLQLAPCKTKILTEVRHGYVRIHIGVGHGAHHGIH
jgi:hypothetical protein